MPYATPRGVLRYHVGEVEPRRWYGLIAYQRRCARKCCRWRWRYLAQVLDTEGVTRWMDRIAPYPSAEWREMKRNAHVLEAICDKP